MPKITVYSTAVCPYCVAAKNLITKRGYSYEEVRIDTDPEQRQRMMELSKRRSVPQIFIGDHHVGGFDELSAMDREGGFVAMMEQSDD